MMTISRIATCMERARIFFLVCLLFHVLCGALPAWAAPLVTAKYAQIAGLEVVAEISINAPPPSTIIVVQSLPSHVAVVSAQPVTSGAKNDKGEVKWLLKGVEVGTLLIHLTLDNPVSTADISGEIRYREPSGDMVTIPIVKP